MLNCLIDLIRSGHLYQSFEDYYSALLVKAPEVAPKAWEARQDYLARVQALATLHAVWCK